MATPQTAVQVQLMMRSFDRKMLESRDLIERLWFNTLLERIVRRVIRRRPHTDDMMQMLVDLGIEPPAENLISRDGLTIRWRS
jgi:hypothetical protein